MINLTNMEIKILNAMRENEYDDCLQAKNSTWIFTVIDNSGIQPTKARGVIASLVKKGLVVTDTELSNVEHCIAFTDEGIKLFDNANGKQCCWGGKRLLEEI